MAFTPLVFMVLVSVDLTTALAVALSFAPELFATVMLLALLFLLSQRVLRPSLLAKTNPSARPQRRLPEQRRARPPDRATTRSAVQLAAEFNAENLRLIEVMEQLSPDQWRLRGANAPGYDSGEDELRTVAQIALHTANQHLVQMAVVRAIVEGRSGPLQAAPTNEEEPAGNPDPEPAEVLRRLRKNGAAAAAAILDLGEPELDRVLTFRGYTMTAAQAVEQLQIGHVRWHRTSIEATVTHSDQGPRRTLT